MPGQSDLKILMNVLSCSLRLVMTCSTRGISSTRIFETFMNPQMFWTDLLIIFAMAVASLLALILSLSAMG